jgi:PTH1 family peptidyl-tRNA hydrolase
VFADSMVLVVGLGNPGQEHSGTRHNIGFEVLGRLCEQSNCRFRAGRGDYYFAEISVEETDAILLLPTTYMNRCGSSVIDAMQEFQIPPDRTLIVVDDFQIPLGTLRLRARGSDGGHNGLASVIYELQTEQFPRLRCGIGSPAMPADRSKMAEFVLDRFTADEIPAVREMIDRAQQACINIFREGIERTMNRVNVRPETDS